MIAARLVFLVLVVLPYALLFLPAQLLILALRLPFWPVLPRLFHRLVAICLGLRVTLVGSLPAGRPVLLVSNHVSWLDIPSVGSLLPVSFLAKSEIGRAPVIGALALLQRTLFVDRARRAGARDAGAAIAGRLAEGGAVLVFPEATSGPGTHVLPFRTALLDAPPPARLQPMAIAYRAAAGLPLGRAERTRLAWTGDMGPFDNVLEIFASGPKEVVIALGEPLAPGLGRKEAARQAEAAVRKMLAALNRGLPLPNIGEGCKPAP